MESRLLFRQFTRLGTSSPISSLPAIYQGAVSGHPRFFVPQVNAEIEFCRTQSARSSRWCFTRVEIIRQKSARQINNPMSGWIQIAASTPLPIRKRSRRRGPNDETSRS
jgi:hypothetical protein